MNQFTFEGKQKSLFTGMIILGVICMIATYIFDSTPFHMRFWSNYLHNTVFFLGIGFVALFVMCAFITAYAGWYTVMKRIWESYSLFLIVGLVLMLPIIAGIWGHFHHLYHWADAAEVAKDPILKGKSGFLNPMWYTVGTFVFVGIWYALAVRFRKLSLAEDENGPGEDFSYHRKMRVVAGILLPVGAFTSAAMIWQWVMSIDAHWYSTMFAWYSTASWFVAMLALTIMMLIYFKSKGYYENVTEEHLHDLGKYLFAFSIFWTYLWFSQYMLIWYSNNGEETIYFKTRVDKYPVLFYANLAVNFALPFLVLMRNSTKRKYGTLMFTCIAVFFGHWWDFFMMIKPGALTNAEHAAHSHGGGHGHGDAHGAHDAAGHAHDAAGHAHDAGHAVAGHAEHAADFVSGFTLPGLLELGTFVGFLGLFLYFSFHQLSKANLVPENDPYIGESLHHHV